MTSTVGLLVALVLSQIQPPALDLVLARAGTFATAFHHDCGRLIADESYVQIYSRSPSSPWMVQSLRSDFAMIADENAAGWHAFRDVVEVNGEPVEGNAGGRLARVLHRAQEASPRLNASRARARAICCAGPLASPMPRRLP